MTTKMIAESVGKDVTSIQRWIKKLNGKMQSIDDKMSLSSPMNPANYTLEETLVIIEQGLGKNAADIYRMNAQPTQNAEVVTKSDLADFGKAIVAEMFKQLIPLLQIQQTSQKQLEYVQDYFSVIAYANIKGIKPTITQAQAYSRVAKKLSIESNVEVRKVEDERYGYVNSYHKDILAKVFEL